MILEQLIKRGIHDSRVLQAMREVDRADFVPTPLLEHAYEDRPLPIGKNQTISQPYIVAYMAQELRLSPGDRVLEIGTGCGYNAAVLSKLAGEVYSIEILYWLVILAQENLKRGSYHNLITKKDDGFSGWPKYAPYNGIVLTAAPKRIPAPLKQQLALEGRLIAPVGDGVQDLVVLRKLGEDTFEEKSLLSVNFVPMTGKAQS